jgi:hypothetical protein
MPNYRNFSAELEVLADVWSTSVMSTDTWNLTGKKWGTNSQPFEVANQNNIRGVAKPGAIINDRCLRAAHEKIVSDLAYVLSLPVPPVVLWDRSEGHVGDRYAAISAWAFAKANEWQVVKPRLKPAQTDAAKRIAGAMRAFDTWIAASDRKGSHVLVSDDGVEDTISVAQIDYAFALSWEWCGVAGAQAEPRAAFPDGVGFDQGVCDEIADNIEKLEEVRISEIVNRVPVEYYSAIPGAKDVILSQLVRRRGVLKGWLK